MKRRTALTITAAVLMVLGAAASGLTEVNPGLTDPNNIVNLFGSSTADDGKVLTFKRVTPTGSLATFSIPTGKTFVITSVDGYYKTEASVPNIMIMKLGINSATNPGFVTANISFYSSTGIASFNLSGDYLFPVPVTTPKLVATVLDPKTMAPVSVGFLAVRVKGYFN